MQATEEPEPEVKGTSGSTASSVRGSQSWMSACPCPQLHTAPALLPLPPLSEPLKLLMVCLKVGAERQHSGKALALHTADPGLTPDIPCGPPSQPGFLSTGAASELPPPAQRRRSERGRSTSACSEHLSGQLTCLWSRRGMMAAVGGGGVQCEGSAPHAPAPQPQGDGLLSSVQQRHWA